MRIKQRRPYTGYTLVIAKTGYVSLRCETVQVHCTTEINFLFCCTRWPEFSINFHVKAGIVLEVSAKLTSFSYVLMKNVCFSNALFENNSLFLHKSVSNLWLFLSTETKRKKQLLVECAGKLYEKYVFRSVFFSFYETVINRLVHGNGIPMGIPWDGAARIAFPMNDNEL